MPYAAPTANESKWMAVDAMPTKTFDPPLTLGVLKSIQALENCPLLTRPRLSVAEISQEHFHCHDWSR